MQSAELFVLLGRGTLPHKGVDEVCNEQLPVVKRYNSNLKLIPQPQQIFGKAINFPLPVQDMVKDKVIYCCDEASDAWWGHKPNTCGEAEENGALQVCRHENSQE